MSVLASDRYSYSTTRTSGRHYRGYKVEVRPSYPSALLLSFEHSLFLTVETDEMGRFTTSGMQVLAVMLQSVVALTSAQNSTTVTSLGLGPATFTAPGAFPTSLYSSYYNAPTATGAVPQPVISDPVLVRSA